MSWGLDFNTFLEGHNSTHNKSNTMLMDKHTMFMFLGIYRICMNCCPIFAVRFQ